MGRLSTLNERPFSSLSIISFSLPLWVALGLSVFLLLFLAQQVAVAFYGAGNRLYCTFRTVSSEVVSVCQVCVFVCGSECVAVCVFNVWLSKNTTGALKIETRRKHDNPLASVDKPHDITYFNKQTSPRGGFPLGPGGVQIFFRNLQCLTGGGNGMGWWGEQCELVWKQNK